MASSRFGKFTDAIVSAYKAVPKQSLRPLPPRFLTEMVFSLTASGLGDCVMLSDLPKAATEAQKAVYVWSGSPHFLPLMACNPFYMPHYEAKPALPWLLDSLRLVEQFDLGNGHILQRLRRAAGLVPMLKPHGCIVTQTQQRSNRVLLHFEPSKQNAATQRQMWHPQMRELYKENQLIIEQFIARHSEMEFIETGFASRGLKGATFMPVRDTGELIKLVASCAWFVGIMSGPLHVAVSTGARCIVIVNHPPAARVVLPTLRRTGTPEEEWHYPQNVHLHQEGGTPLVPRLSLQTLEAAFDGQVYPFWSDYWLSLVQECA